MKISVSFEGNSTSEVVKEMVGYIENLGQFTIAHVINKPEIPEDEGAEDGAHRGEVEEVCPS